MLIPAVTVVVHPIDTSRFPDVPAGWRWAVQCCGQPPQEIEYCAQAGWAATQTEAGVEGEAHGAAAARALRFHGVPVEYKVLFLDHDPVPTGAGKVNPLVLA